MYGFILNMWVFGKIDEERVRYYVSRGFITQEEADQILATPQDPDSYNLSVSAE